MTLSDSLTSHLRPLKCAYNPLLPAAPGTSPFLTEQVSAILAKSHPNSILITPRSSDLAVPWPSSIPLARQNIHWKAAETAVRALLPQIHALSASDGAKIPQGLLPNDSACNGTRDAEVERTKKRIEEKETEFVDTVVGCAIYMHPNANKERTELIAQALLVLWTHDDTVEHTPGDLGHTATDHIMRGFTSTLTTTASIPNPASLFQTLFAGLFASSPALGLDLANSMLAFVRNTCTTQAPAAVHAFPTLRAYLDFRSVDFGREFNFAAVRFALDLELNAAQLRPFKRLEDLADDHHMLVNDLYSFAKEREECDASAAAGKPKPLVNAVAVVRELLGLGCWEDAKRLVGDLVLRWEEMARAELGVLDAMRWSEGLSDGQWAYVEGIWVSMAGNQFFSATAPRYWRKVTGEGEEGYGGGGSGKGVSDEAVEL